MPLKGIFEITSFCPFMDTCESYQTIERSEQWISKALSQMRRVGQDRLPESEGGYTALVLEDKLGQMSRIKDRCYRNNKRCLKFWQFNRNRESTIASIELRKNLTINKETDSSSIVAENQV